MASEVISDGTTVARLKKAAKISGGKESVRWESDQREKEKVRWREKKIVKYEMQSYNNRAYMCDYCSIFAFIQTYASADVSGFFLLKFVKPSTFCILQTFATTNEVALDTAKLELDMEQCIKIVVKHWWIGFGPNYSLLMNNWVWVYQKKKKKNWVWAQHFSVD